MCTLVVIARDLTDGYSADAADRLAWRIGDTVDILEDGADPGEDIRENPAFRVIHMPGVPKRDMLQYTSGEYRWNGDEKLIVRRRMWQIDLAALEGDDPRQLKASDELTVQKSRWQAVQTKKPLVTDPAVIGGSTDIRIIG